MPGMFLTPTEWERLAGLPVDIPHWDLLTSSTLTEYDRALIDTY